MGALSEELPTSADPEVADPTGEKAAMSRIPQMAGSEKVAELKADYLGFRACGFRVREACHLSGITQTTLSRWRKSDPAFAVLESDRLPELQSTVADDLVKLEFMRNMRMAMRADHNVLYKAVHHLEALTPREFSYLKKIRALYSPQDLMSIQKALSPSEGETGDFAQMVYRLTETRTQLEVSIAPKLDADSENVQTVHEGEYKEV